MDISCTVYAFSLRVFERVLFADCCNLSAKASAVNCKSVLATIEQVRSFTYQAIVVFSKII